MILDVNIFLFKLPRKTKESIVLNEDDSYTIFIAEWLSVEEQRKVFFHAVLHIMNRDFVRDNVDDLELQALKLLA